MNTRALISMILLAASGAGCELAGPLLIGEATKDDEAPATAEFAPLSVTVESAEGTVAGHTLAPEMFEASGDRFGSEIQIQLRASDDLELWVTTQTESSSTNPYTGEDFSDDGFGGSAGVRIPDSEGGDSDNTPTEPFAELRVCEAGSCRPATDFGIEIVQTEAGRDAIVDGVWGEEETIQVSLNYTEM